MRTMTTKRLNKYLAHCGVDSRRHCDEIIAAGRVTVNGRKIVKMGHVVYPGDRVCVDGNEVQPVEDDIYVVLNKPLETLSSVDDPFKRTTIVTLVATPQRIYPVGRLDYNTTGVILLTNDGSLTNRLLHPRYKAPKVYRVLLDKKVKTFHLHHLRKGVELDGRKTHPCKIREMRMIDNCSLLEVELREGRKRQIRDMFALFDYKVQELDRISFAGITYKGLKRGQWRNLTPEEVAGLKKLVHYNEVNEADNVPGRNKTEK